MSVGRVIHELRGHPQLVVGAVICGLFALFAIFGPLVVPHDPIEQHLRARLLPPGSVAPGGQVSLLGTDQLGRDIFSRLVVGARISFAIATISVAVGVAFGALIGVVAGYLGRPWDGLVMRVVDLQMAFPFLFLGLIIVGLFGNSLTNMIAVLVVWGWVVYARVARAMVLSLKHADFVLASEALGASRVRIVFRHLLPAVADTVAVIAALQVGRVLIAEAGLEFLGLGVPAPTPVWGGMLSDGRGYLATAWWVSTMPGLAITTVVIGANLFGSGLRSLRT